MPRRSSPDNNHHTHRLELQQHERDALDMVAASLTFKNVGDGIGAVLRPFTQCTLEGAIMAFAIFETLLFTQDKGLLRAIFGGIEDVADYTYAGLGDFKSRMQNNFVQNKETRAEQVNPDHRTEISERESLRDYQTESAEEGNILGDSSGYFWSPVRGGWVDPVTGSIVSKDRNDPLYT